MCNLVCLFIFCNLHLQWGRDAAAAKCFTVRDRTDLRFVRKNREMGPVTYIEELFSIYLTVMIAVCEGTGSKEDIKGIFPL